MIALGDHLAEAVGQPLLTQELMHRRAGELLAANVERIRDGQWRLPTPCAEWDVRDLVQGAAVRVSAQQAVA